MNKLSFLALCFMATGLYAQNVNQFTGSFSYDVPLINLPSNRGTGISIDASYGAGIQMNQAASEIGLGWNLSAGGAIYRSVSGLPDDTKSFNSVALPSGGTIVNGCGALYPAGASTFDYDFARTARGLDSGEVILPGFDNYQVAGPGPSGVMKLSYLKFYGYDNDLAAPYKYEPLVIGSSAYFRKPQFHMAGDFSDTIVSRHYPTSINGSTPFKIPTDNISGNGYTNNEPFIGKHLNGSTISNQNYDLASGRVASSNLIEYFTNGEIANAYGSGFTGSLIGFIDNQLQQWHNAPNFPADGIGAFRITASNGMTYHYSLPVYETEQTAYYIPLNKDYSLTTPNLNTTDFTSSTTDIHPSNSNVTIKSKAANRTAVKWLLTAITGPDFVDANNNHQVDDGDQGYWMSYDYQLWQSDFVQRSPQYGYNTQYNPDPVTQNYPAFLPFQAVSGNSYKLSGLNGVVNVSKTEVYYLSKIRSSSHTAIFVRDVRSDEKGQNPDVDNSTNTSFKPSPSLLVKRIVLFRNEQFDSIVGAHAPTSFNPSNYTSFNFSNTNNGTAVFFTEAWYQAQYNNLSFCILKHIYFDQDYSLCRKYHGNINVNWTNSTVLKSPATVMSNMSTANYSSSGKLTLNRIVTYDFQNGKVTPSILLDYGSSNNSYNPDYNPIKTDYWGYYKSDATESGYSAYTTVLSGANARAWSLAKITDPLGGITEVEYESNTYNKVIDNEVSNGVRGPAYIYRIKDATTIAGSYDITMEEGYNAQSQVSEFLTFASTSIPGMNARICLPHFQSPVDATWASLDPTSSALSNGFFFGNCTFAVTPSGGTTNHVTGAVTAIYSNGVTGIRNVFRYDLERMYTWGSNPSGVSTLNNFEAPSDPNTYCAYSGNGFIQCEMPIGYTAYGNGVRVKYLKTRNSFSAQNETYVTEYTYEDGVATAEADRFNFQVLKTNCMNSKPRYDFLKPKSYEVFDLSPSIGYSKVTVKDLGRINNPNGKTETTFITDPSAEGGSCSQNNAITTFTSVSGSPTNFYTLRECVNKFSNLFGSTKESRVYDKNNNMLSRTVWEYAPTEQGAWTENFYFRDQYHGSLNYPNCFGSGYDYRNSISHTVTIVRDYPVVIKSTTSYGIGSKTKSESLRRDEVTGETTAIRSIGANQSASISYKTPAYQFYQPSDNIDFTMRAFRTILPLGNDMFTYSNVDSTLSLTGGNGMSASFLGSGYKLYSKKIRQRQYGSTGFFSTAVATLPYYAPNRAFGFDAGASSKDVYGLLSKSMLGSNPLSLSSHTNITIWEPSGTYNWKLIYENTLLDQYKNLVEVRDANNRFSASRFGYTGYYKSASVSNCNYASFSFADFETPPATNAFVVNAYATVDGDMVVGSSNTFIKNTDLVGGSLMIPHTGVKCVSVGSNPVSFSAISEQSASGTMELGLQTGRYYRASVWAHNTNLSNAVIEVTFNGTVNSGTPYSYNTVLTANSTNNLVCTMGNWNLLQLDFEVPDKFVVGVHGEFTIRLKSANGSTVYFDDFVFHPVESSFSAEVYNPRNGRVMSMIDGNGLATNFVYDAAGRTLEVWKEIPSVGYKRTTVHTYNYARGASN